MRRSVLVSAIAAGLLVIGTVPALASNQRVWLHTYSGGDNDTAAYAVAVDPGNGHVYVQATVGCCIFSTADTVAYRSDGTKLWTMNSGDPIHDEPAAIAVDPGSHDVLVTGRRSKAMFTEAYSSTGALLWTTVRKVTGYELAPVGIVSDGHGHVVVLAESDNESAGTSNFLTIAYNLSTGVRSWLVHYGVTNSDDPPVGIAADPARHQVYVVGSSMGTNFQEMVTIAYDSGTGGQAWLARDVGGDDIPAGISVDTSNHHVYSVTETDLDVAQWDTFAYGPAAGSQLWHSTYQDPDGFNASPEEIGTDSANGQVYVAGFQRTATSGTLSVLVGYSSAGAQLWSKTFDDGNATFPRALATDTTNHRIYVSGDRTNSSGETITITRAVSDTGSLEWNATLSSPVTNGVASAGAAAADGGRAQVYVVGGESNNNGGSQAFTAAYHA